MTGPDGDGGARTGRRPGTSDTRASIIDAAREVFAERGYDGATIRGVADRAGVDPALLYHYFGSKQQLFVAAMEIPYHFETVLPGIVNGPAERMGERLVLQLLRYWEDPEVKPLFMGVVRSAATDPTAAAMVRRMLSEGPFTVLARATGAPDGELRAMLAATHVMGLAMLRYIIGVEPLASTPLETLAAWIGPTVQRYLTEGPGERSP